jgi:GSH-dependent disulfide-bond oxidoreductase
VPAAIELYFWPTPNGKKISIALEEFALPYTVHLVNISTGEQFKPEFLQHSPNNRIPAIMDPEGPDGAPISVFESGAILQYLARKTGQLYGANERERIEIDQWVFWQMAGLGPMSGQANHFRNYAPAMVEDEKLLEYGRNRYTNEVNRLFGVLDRRLQGRDYVVGAFSIADIINWTWIPLAEKLGQNLDDFPNLKSWFERVGARPAVIKGAALAEDASKMTLADKSPEADAARKLLFGQRSRTGD